MTAQIKKRMELTKWQLIKENVLMLWDGLGFFGTGLHKLDRLERKKFKWWHKLMSLSEILTLVTSLIIIIYIFFSEFIYLGTIKS